jgi:hypothetical protein
MNGAGRAPREQRDDAHLDVFTQWRRRAEGAASAPGGAASMSALTTIPPTIWPTTAAMPEVAP